VSSEYDDLIMLAERRELEAALAKAARERDELKTRLDHAEAERLRHERRMFRRRLVECLPWVGCTPYPNTRHFDEMIACRDLAKDTLDEVPE
jgi:hypothetical protein